MPVTLESIRDARERIKDVIYHSACNYSLSLSRLCNAEIYCKLDHLQVTGSFKERGARNKLKLLQGEIRGTGALNRSSIVHPPSSSSPSLAVIAASAGNHAQGLA